uniref:Uncharacterized protein n=1 Tax=Ralstonia syzygii R24 TaxID=907261 RepID=G3A1P4_9RALS|nr:hypothetical protein RALSY_11151 [Ralstonia syzygii R24]
MPFSADVAQMHVSLLSVLYKSRGGRQTAPIPGPTPHERVERRQPKTQQLASGGGRAIR